MMNPLSIAVDTLAVAWETALLEPTPEHRQAYEAAKEVFYALCPLPK